MPARTQARLARKKRLNKGAVQNWIATADITPIQIEYRGTQDTTTAGTEGYAKGNLAVTPGQTLYTSAASRVAPRLPADVPEMVKS